MPDGGREAVNEKRWTIWPCPQCGEIIGSEPDDSGCDHIATSSAWPMAEPVEVVAVAEVDRLTRELRQYVDTLARRDSEIATMFSRDEYRALGEKVNRLTRELEEAKYALAAERRQVTEMCVLAGHPLEGGACRCGERRA